MSTESLLSTVFPYFFRVFSILFYLFVSLTTWQRMGLPHKCFSLHHFANGSVGNIITNSTLFAPNFSVLSPSFLHANLFHKSPSFHDISMLFPWYISQQNFNTMEKGVQNVCCVTIYRPLNMVFPH